MSDRIRERREALGLSQVELGQKVGVGQATVSRWENGTARPSVQTLQRLAEALRCSLGYLFGETDDPSPLPEVMAAHQRVPPGTPLRPEEQLAIERAVRAAIREYEEYKRRQQDAADKAPPESQESQ